MKIFKVDAEKRTVTELDVTLSVDKINELIGSRCFTGGPIIGKNETFVDDEGLLTEQAYFIKVKGHKQCFEGNSFAGNILVVGPADDKGDTTDAIGTVEDVISCVTFLGLGEIS